MEKNIINLKFDKATTRLAGNPYGKDEFKEQVKEKINYNQMNVIRFPDNIEKIASSFTQGFFSEIINKVGYEGFKNVITVEAKTPKLVNEILEDIYY